PAADEKMPSAGNIFSRRCVSPRPLWRFGGIFKEGFMLRRTGVVVLLALGVWGIPAAKGEGVLAQEEAFASGPQRLCSASSLATRALYTMTNDASKNEVVAYYRGRDGRLKAAGVFSTGGKGTGSGLGNQGALALS